MENDFNYIDINNLEYYTDAQILNFVNKLREEQARRQREAKERAASEILEIAKHYNLDLTEFTKNNEIPGALNNDLMLGKPVKPKPRNNT